MMYRREWQNILSVIKCENLPTTVHLYCLCQNSRLTAHFGLFRMAERFLTVVQKPLKQFLVNFYCCAISNVLTISLLVWFSSCIKVSAAAMQGWAILVLKSHYLECFACLYFDTPDLNGWGINRLLQNLKM